MSVRDRHGRFVVSPLTQMHQARDSLKASVDRLAHNVDRLRHDNAMARDQRGLDHAGFNTQWVDRHCGIYGEVCVELHTAAPVLERIAVESAASVHELREMNDRFEAERAERAERAALFLAVTQEQRDSGVFSTTHRSISGSTITETGNR